MSAIRFLGSVFLLGIALLCYSSYKAFNLQKKTYQENMIFILSNECSNIIERSYAQYATKPHIIHGEKDPFFNTEIEFDNYNNILAADVSVESSFYYSGWAPQTFNCKAYFYAYKDKLSPQTKVSFLITKPNFLPDEFLNLSVNKNPLIYLTFADMGFDENRSFFKKPDLTVKNIFLETLGSILFYPVVLILDFIRFIFKLFSWLF